MTSMTCKEPGSQRLPNVTLLTDTVTAGQNLSRSRQPDWPRRKDCARSRAQVFQSPPQCFFSVNQAKLVLNPDFLYNPKPVSNQIHTGSQLVPAPTLMCERGNEEARV